MEHLQTYLNNNKDNLIQCGFLIGKAIVGTILMGLTLACFYFLHFIYGVLQLQKGSRKYYQLREHIMTESLIRYGITIVCIFTIDILIFNFFSWGASSFLLGIGICCLYFVIGWIRNKINGNKVKSI